MRAGIKGAPGNISRDLRAESRRGRWEYIQLNGNVISKETRIPPLLSLLTPSYSFVFCRSRNVCRESLRKRNRFSGRQRVCVSLSELLKLVFGVSRLVYSISTKFSELHDVPRETWLRFAHVNSVNSVHRYERLLQEKSD